MTSNARFFLWINLSPFFSTNSLGDQGWAAEKELNDRLLESGVAMASSAAYSAEVPGWFRIIFAVDEDTLREGIRRSVVLLIQ